MFYKNRKGEAARVVADDIDCIATAASGSTST